MCYSQVPTSRGHSSGTAHSISVCRPPSTWINIKTYLDKADISGLLPESLTTHVQAVLADDASALLLARDDAARRSLLAHARVTQVEVCGGEAMVDEPAARALAVGTGAGVPNRLVRHRELVIVRSVGD